MWLKKSRNIYSAERIEVQILKECSLINIYYIYLHLHFLSPDAIHLERNSELNWSV